MGKIRSHYLRAPPIFERWQRQSPRARRLQLAREYLNQRAATEAGKARPRSARQTCAPNAPELRFDIPDSNPVQSAGNLQSKILCAGSRPHRSHGSEYLQTHLPDRAGFPRRYPQPGRAPNRSCAQQIFRAGVFRGRHLVSRWNAVTCQGMSTDTLATNSVSRRNSSSDH